MKNNIEWFYRGMLHKVIDGQTGDDGDQNQIMTKA